MKTVVEEVEDDKTEISLKNALRMSKTAVLGQEMEMESLSHQASRIAAQTAKQVVLQRLREAEREMVYEEFAKRVDDIISGVVGQVEVGRGIVVELDRAEAILPPEEQVMTERYRRGQRLKVYATEVTRSARGPEIVVSRTHKNLLKRLFELEVPEVYNGIVDIRSIAREAGSRSKVAVIALQDGVDPIGSCIGMRGNRIQNIVNELQGEKIDVVRWDRDLKRFISNALSPAEVVQVVADEEDHSAVVVVAGAAAVLGYRQGRSEPPGWRPSSQGGTWTSRACRNGRLKRPRLSLKRPLSPLKKRPKKRPKPRKPQLWKTLSLRSLKWRKRSGKKRKWRFLSLKRS